MSIRLVQQGACDMMCACAVQKRPEECIGFMWPVGPYIARERRVGEWIESFRYCQACSGWFGGPRNSSRPRVIPCRLCLLSTPVDGSFVLRSHHSIGWTLGVSHGRE